MTAPGTTDSGTARRRRFRRRRIARRLLAVVGVTSLVTLVAWAGLTAGAFAGFQRRAGDALQPGATADPRVVVVGVDRASIAASIAELGQPWPWPRDLLAQLVDGISAAGAETLVVDVTLNGERSGDAALIGALEEIPDVVLASSLELDGGANERLLTARAATDPTPALAATGTVAHAEVFQDEADAVVRSVPLALEDPDGEVRPGLALAAYQALTGTEGPITIRPGGVQVGDDLLPTGETTALRVNYAPELIDDPTSARFVSAGAVLDGELASGSLDDAVVLLGVTDSTQGDQRLAPTAKASGMPGVFVHANALNTMLTESFLYPSSDASALAWVAALAGLTAAAVLFLPLIPAIVAVGAVAVGHLLLAFARFDGGREPELVYTNLGIAAALVLALGAKYLLETRHRRRVARLFERYIPEQVARELVEEGHDVSTAGSLAEITVFFCDLRGFTAMSAERTPSEVRDILNVYYREVVAAILGHGGTVMQFVGDEVFAIFGAPLAMADHPARAMAAAVDAQAVARSMADELGERGLPPVHYGIGLNVGDVVTGHVGDAHRLQYAVVGDAVNVGSRFCSLARAGEIVCSEAVLARVPDAPRTEDVGPVDLKGVTRELRLYRVPPPPGSPAGTLPRQERRMEKAVERPTT